ncbi:MAG: hypothetical protein K2X29_01180 [Candidatus Obscuribacterales bacterium]|nr:hypothetical protein [Candidatus Obscuribacterales bacterium]
MNLLISDAVQTKLREKHRVNEYEILECFVNRKRSTLIDNRERHRTDPPTRWFIADTDNRRRLKVVFIQLTRMDFVIRTAYEPDVNEERFYQTNSRG